MDAATRRTHQPLADEQPTRRTREGVDAGPAAEAPTASESPAAAPRKKPSRLRRVFLFLFLFVTVHEGCIALSAKRVSSAVPMQDFDGVTQVWADYESLAARSWLFGLAVQDLGQALVRQSMILSDQVIGNYRTPQPSVREAQWESAAVVLRRALTAIEGNDIKIIKELERADDDVDKLHEAIKLYLIQASKTDMSEDESRRHVEILTFTTNLEHIGDIIDKNLMDLAAKKVKKRAAFSPEGLAELKRFHAQVVDNMRLALNVFASRDVALARRLLVEKTGMRAKEFEAAEHHFARLRSGRPESIETSAIHVDIIRDLKRINSHLTSVAYPILEAAGELRESRLREQAAASKAHAT